MSGLRLVGYHYRCDRCGAEMVQRVIPEAEGGVERLWHICPRPS